MKDMKKQIKNEIYKWFEKVQKDYSFGNNYFKDEFKDEIAKKAQSLYEIKLCTFNRHFLNTVDAYLNTVEID